LKPVEPSTETATPGSSSSPIRLIREIRGQIQISRNIRQGAAHSRIMQVMKRFHRIITPHDGSQVAQRIMAA
jgi:hypothetical protein